MKTAIIVLLSFVMALIVYGIYVWFQNKNTSVSPVPEEGIKVIQISP